MARRSSPSRKNDDAPFPRRIKRLRKAAAAIDCDHALVTDPVDVGYFTGFLGGDSYLLVGPSGKPVVISDRRYEEDLEAFKPALRVVMRDGSIVDKVVELLGGLAQSGRLERVAVQPEHVTLRLLEQLRAAAKRSKLPARLFVPEAGLAAKLRAIKDDHEVALIRRAVRVQEAALDAVMPDLRPGQSELEIAARLEFEMKRRGSTEPAFGTTVAAAANSSRPHHQTGGTKARAGRPLLIDFGATIDGYRSDMTRVLAFGRWPREIRDAYAVVLEAHRAAAEALAAGVLCREVDRAARDVIDRAGYGGRFGHGLGHGLGRRVHEAPSLSQRAADTDVLEAGHVVTVEPGVYLPGVGGVRLENDYLVTERGAKNLCSMPMDIERFTL